PTGSGLGGSTPVVDLSYAHLYRRWHPQHCRGSDKPRTRRQTNMSELKTLMTGLVVGESPRWHAGRLWFSNWGAQEIIAVDAQGKSEVMVKVPTTVPFCIDWQPDGRMLIVSGQEARLLRQESDSSLVTYA